jgi:anti-sigma factor RsiW
MSGHDDVREMLALAAAGALTAEEMRRVEEHSRNCDACSAELAAWRGLAGEVRELPGPRAPEDLAARAVNRLRGQLAASAEKRWDNAVLAVLTLFAWTVGLASWAIARIVTGGLLIALDTSFATWLIWLAASTVLVWMTAGAAAIMLGRGHRLARRNS